MRASLTLRELVAHDAVDQVDARLEAEDRIGQVNRTGGRAVEGRNIKFHH
jgi:hypothetical protein